MGKVERGAVTFLEELKQLISPAEVDVYIYYAGLYSFLSGGCILDSSISGIGFIWFLLQDSICWTSYFSVDGSSFSSRLPSNCFGLLNSLG